MSEAALVSSRTVDGPGCGPLRGWIRFVRVATLGSASLALAAGAHLLGGGMLPNPGVLLVAVLLVGLASVHLTARRCQSWLLLVVLGLQQLVLHLFFGAAAQSVCQMPSGHHAAMHPGALICTPGHPMEMGAHLASPAGRSMVLAHVVATGLTALLLARGEAWLWRQIGRILGPVSAAPGEYPVTVGERVWPAVSSASAGQLVYASASPRGPPRLGAWN